MTSLLCKLRNRFLKIGYTLTQGESQEGFALFFPADIPAVYKRPKIDYNELTILKQRRIPM
ncbi:hypothetical protein D1159_01155 [Pseudoflavonifractor sp. 524-17]|nr:hypothetical protein [Pseudoflavonifractor sp. 524-17]